MSKRALFPSIAGFVFLMGATSAPPAYSSSCEYWLAPPPVGSDSNPGTVNAPWATLEHASEASADNACTIWVNPGVYFGNHRINRRYTSQTFFKAVEPYKAVFENTGPVVNVSGAARITFSGLQFRHAGTANAPLVFVIDQNDKGWAENIELRDNIFHDSYDNDLLKIHDGVKFVSVFGNVFYNQGSGEEHIDVNSVTDVTIEQNLFFNDFAGSGRPALNDTKNFIVIKDSNGTSDGQIGSERVSVARNVFLNWEGLEGETFIQVGKDGKPYHEAKTVRVENNLFLGNAQNESGAIFGVAGAKDVIFSNNTISGDLPAWAYAFRIVIKEANPLNEDIAFYNNIWSDPTGTMGADLSGGANEFSDGDLDATINLVLDNNLYWNGGQPIPAGDLLSPLTDDPRPLVGDPGLETDQAAVILPRWTGASFVSGSATVQEEFLRLVSLYGTFTPGSPAVDQADPIFAPAEDILGNPRGTAPDMGAFEALPPVLPLQVYLPVISSQGRRSASTCR